MDNIYASCISLGGQGVLLFGKSGSGKSDLCLRLITEHGAKLVADDRVDLIVSRETILASAPTTLEGLLEIRGVGIIKVAHEEQVSIHLAVDLVAEEEEIERFPEPLHWTHEGCAVPLIKLHAFEASAPAKILAALGGILGTK